MTIRPAGICTHRTTPKPRWQWVTVLLLLLSLLGGSAPANGQESGPLSAPKPLDVILLIDSSPSTRETDRSGWRISASRFLLDYLQATSQVLRVNYRAGVANFGGRMGATTPLRLLEGGIVQGTIVSETVSYTDFRPPLDWALREFRARSFGVGNAMAIILFTDGNPQLTDQRLTAEQKAQYFTGQSLAGDASELRLPGLVKELQDAGITVLTVGIGDARQDASFWQNLVGADNYRSLDDAANLPAIYHEFAVRLLGAVASPARFLQAADSPARETVPPYLEQVIFSFVKEKPAVQVTLTDPTGKTYSPTAGGQANDLHQIYAIANPAPGAWQITVSGGSTQLWVDQRLSRLLIEGPQGPQILRQPLPLTARLVRNGEAITDQALQIRISVALPGAGGAIEEAMAPTDGGAFVFTLVPTLSGVYTVTATTRLNDQLLAVGSAPLVVAAYPAPSVARFQVDGAIAPGQTVILRARLNDWDRLARDQAVEAVLFDQAEMSLGTVSLHDDGRAPDQQAGDGAYSADLIIAPSLQAVELAIAGRTVNGVSFSLRERYSLAQAMITTTPATVVATPTLDTRTPTVSSATPTTPTADRTPTPSPTPPPGDKSGIEGGDWGWLALALAAGAAVAGGILLWRVINPGALRLRQVEQDLTGEQQTLENERSEQARIRAEYDATREQLNAEQSAKKETEEQLKREQEAHERTRRQWQEEKEEHERTRGQWQGEKEEHERTRGQWQGEKEEHERTRGQWQEDSENLKNERDRLREENERLHKAQEHYERAQQAFEQHDTREAKNQLYQALGEVPKYESASTEVAVDLLDNILSDLLTKVYQNRFEDQRELLYGQLKSDASPAQVRATARVLQRRWIEKPDILMDEFAHILELPRGIETISEMKQALVNVRSDDQRTRLNAIRKIAEAYCP